MLVIHWKSLITGATGNGILPTTDQSIVDQLNYDYSGEIYHWLAPLPEEK